MARCIYCKETIDKSNETVEHILPNGIGGKLKSKRLVCKKCNNRFGEEIDVELLSQLNQFSTLLNIKRDRGKPRWVKAERTGEVRSYYIKPGGKPVIGKPMVEIKDDGKAAKVTIEARDTSELRHILRGVKRRYPKFNVDEVLKQARYQKEYLKDSLHFNLSIGGPHSFRAISKIAYNYYRYKNPDEEGLNFNDIERYIKGELAEKDFVWFYYSDKDVIIKQPIEILHSIALKGNLEDYSLYAYVELFNAFKFIVLLSTEYTGRVVEQVYNYNVVNRKEVFRSFDLNLTLEDIRTLLSEKPQFFNLFRGEFGSLLSLIHRKQTEEYRNEIIERAIKNSFIKHPQGSIITQQMLNEFVDELMKGMIPFLSESSLKKDWLRPEEDKAWRDL